MKAKAVTINANMVTIVNGHPRTTSLILAEGLERPHHGIIQLVRQYQRDLEEFGRVAFEMRTFDTKGGPQQQEYALLNEHQAMLLLSFMRNTDAIREFKKNLIKAFFALGEELQRVRGLTANTNADALLSLFAEVSQRGYATDFLPTLVQCRRAGLSCEQTSRVLRCSSSAVSTWHRKLTDAGVDLPSGSTRSATATYFKRLSQSGKDGGQLALFPVGALQ